MKIKIVGILVYMLLITATVLPAVSANFSQPVCPHTEAQVSSFDRRGGVLQAIRYYNPDTGVCIGDNPCSGQHYQGVQRYDGYDGHRYFFLTRSGNKPGFWAYDPHGPGELLIVDRGKGGGGPLNSGDGTGTVVRSFHFVAGNTPLGAFHRENPLLPNTTGDRKCWGHPGSGQIVGDYFFIPMEWPGNLTIGGWWSEIYQDKYDGAVIILNVSDPKNPTFVREIYMSGTEENPGKIGCLSVIWDSDENKYFFITATGNGKEFKFWESQVNATPENMTMNLVHTWKNFNLLPDGAEDNHWDNHQGLYLVRDHNGILYLIGTAKQSDDTGWIRLLQINWTAKTITYKEEVELQLDDPEDFGSMSAVGGMYVSPEGQLICYTGQHDNDGDDTEGCDQGYSGCDGICAQYQIGEFVSSFDCYTKKANFVAIGVPGEKVDDKEDTGSVDIIYNGGATQKWHQDIWGIEDMIEDEDHFGGGELKSYKSVKDEHRTTLASGDFNGDGWPDLAVGVPDEDESGDNAGMVNVIYGSEYGLTYVNDQRLFDFDDKEKDDHFGWALAVGDFNGDGFDDLAVGAPKEDVSGEDDAGMVRYFKGTDTGLMSWGKFWRAPEKDDHFGWALAAGDFNGDGLDDLAVGAPKEDVWFGDNNNDGYVYYYKGTADSLQYWGDLCDSDEVEKDDHFGYALAAGDIDGDGYDDLIVGAPAQDVEGKDDAGHIYGWKGSGSNLIEWPSYLLDQNDKQGWRPIKDNDYFGYALAIGVANRPPEVTLLGPTSVDEGSTGTYTFTVDDPDGDNWEISMGYPSCDCGNIRSLTNGSDGGSFAVDFPDNIDSCDIYLQLKDSHGATGSAKITVTVNNVAPSAFIDMIDRPNPHFIFPIVHTLTFEGSFTDPGWLDTHTTLWEFGDGNSSTGMTVEENEKPDATGNSTASYVYPLPGMYTVTFTVTDDDGGVVADTALVEVVDAEYAVEELVEYIQNLSDDAFDKKAPQRKKAMANKCSALVNMLNEGNYEEAIEKLHDDLRAKADGCLGGKAKNDWVTDCKAQQSICEMIDDMIVYLQTLNVADDDDGDNVVTITLTDGGLGDNDGVANGVIMDPGGIGIPSAPEIPANVVIKPETLNLKSKGEFTAFITLPEPYNVTDINISTVVCEGAPAVKGMVADDNKYIAKFDRENLREDLLTGDAVQLTVIGKVFYNGGYADFEGSDTIRVIDKG